MSYNSFISRFISSCDKVFIHGIRVMGKRISVHHSLTTILAFNYFLKSGCIIRITVSKPSKISWRKNGFWFGLSELAVVNLYIHPRSTISMDNERTLVAGESHVFLICLIFLSQLLCLFLFFLTSLVDLRNAFDLV